MTTQDDVILIGKSEVSTRDLLDGIVSQSDVQNAKTVPTTEDETNKGQNKTKDEKEKEDKKEKAKEKTQDDNNNNPPTSNGPIEEQQPTPTDTKSTDNQKKESDNKDEPVVKIRAIRPIRRTKSSSMIQDDVVPLLVPNKTMTEDKTEKEITKRELNLHQGCINRPKIISRFYYGPHNESYLLECAGAELVNGSLFVQGIKGIGVTASVVSAYLVEELKLPLVAIFHSPNMAAMCSTYCYRPTPPVRIYGNADVCVAVGDLPFSAIDDSALLWYMAQAFCDFARRHRCKHVVTVEGLPIENELEKEIQKIAKREGLDIEHHGDEIVGVPRDSSEDEMDGAKDVLEMEQHDQHPQLVISDSEDAEQEEDQKTKDPYATIRYITCCETLAKKLYDMGHRPVKTGQILGVTGALLSLSTILSDEDPPFTALLAPDPVNMKDQRGALMAVKLLRDLFGLQLDTTTLDKETQKLADKTNLIITNIKEQIQNQLDQLKPGSPPPYMYM